MAKAKREFKTESEVWRAVEGVGGVKWAAAFCDVSQEAVYQWLERGFIPTGSYAVLLAEAAIAEGHRVSLRLLVGLDAKAPRPPRGSGRAPGRSFRCYRAVRRPRERGGNEARAAA